MDIHQKQWKESVSHLFATWCRESCPINTQGGELLSIIIGHEIAHTGVRYQDKGTEGPF